MLNSLLGKLYRRGFSSNTRLERIWKIAQVDFKKRYYNDKFGLLWALINPLSQIVLYYFVFTRIFQRGEENFVLFLFSGLIMWLAFAQATQLGLKVLINKIHLIESVQFNWLDLYTSHMISILMGLLFNVTAYLILLLILGQSVGPYFLLFPVILLNWFLISAGASIILGLIRPIFEDIIHIWSLSIMVGFWVSGVFFSGSFYLENYSWFSYLNPFVGILLNTRACLLVNNDFYISLFFINLVYGLLLYLISIFLFRKYSKKVLEQL